MNVAYLHQLGHDCDESMYESVCGSKDVAQHGPPCGPTYKWPDMCWANSSVTYNSKCHWPKVLVLINLI